MELEAENEMESGGVEIELKGDFRSEFDRQRLRGEFKDNALVSGTTISFCLVTSSGSMALAVAKTGSNDGNEAQFELDSKKGQTVPTVVAGNKLEARQGATTGGTADCSAPLLASATFQPKEEEENDH